MPVIIVVEVIGYGCKIFYDLDYHFASECDKNRMMFLL